MFFLIRTTFWLGLVFCAMDWPADAPSIPTKEVVVSAAAGQASKLCARNPQACLEAAGLASDFVKPPAPAQKPPGKPKADTLEKVDKAPGWRGRG
jgi:hypothetical protein